MKTICLDFDGVIHSYTSGWCGEAVIVDHPVDGAFEWLEKAVDLFDIVILSSRSKSESGRAAMKAWFLVHGLDSGILQKITFAEHKPPAFLTIDDRAICFNGTFPTVEEIENFKPWYK